MQDIKLFRYVYENTDWFFNMVLCVFMVNDIFQRYELLEE